MSNEKDVNVWAVIDLMGHAQTAGIIMTSDLGWLLRVDVPFGDGFRTEFYGPQAIYSVRIVSEEVARAFAIPEREICAYAQFEEALEKSRRRAEELETQLGVLQRRLTAINALPEHVE